MQVLTLLLALCVFRAGIIEQRTAGGRESASTHDPSFGRFARRFLLPSIRLPKAKQKLVGVTADRRVEHIFGVIVVLVCKN
jgi:hypothetical protein